MTSSLLEAPVDALEPSRTATQATDTPSPIPSTPPTELSLPPASPNTTPPATTASGSADTQEADDIEDDNRNLVSSSLELDSPEFTKATISIYLQVLPHDNHPEGRPVILGIRSHDLPPLTLTRRWNQLLPLPTDIDQLLQQWQSHYPTAIQDRKTSRDVKREQERQQAEARKTENKRRQEEKKNQKPARRTENKTPVAPAKQLRAPTAAASAAPPAAESTPPSTQSSLF